MRIYRDEAGRINFDGTGTMTLNKNETALRVEKGVADVVIRNGNSYGVTEAAGKSLRLLWAQLRVLLAVWRWLRIDGEQPVHRPVRNWLGALRIWGLIITQLLILTSSAFIIEFKVLLVVMLACTVFIIGAIGDLKRQQE